MRRWIVAAGLMVMAGGASMPMRGQVPELNAPAGAPMGSMSMAHGSMGAHMMFSALRPMRPGDQAKADAIAAAAKVAIEPYLDYKKALAEGYKIFLPNVPQKMYHFTSYENGFVAARRFDASKPTSLLYEKTATGYKLVGAMYTDRKNASEAALDERIPLSVGRWHQHVNFCKAPAGREKEYFGKDAKYGLLGSISTREACDAAGGEFQPSIFGWMVHVYPFETDPKEVWSVERDEDDGDMKGMKM